MTTGVREKEGLSRGLSALLPTAVSSAPVRLPSDEEAHLLQGGHRAAVSSPEQPRRKFDDVQLAELAESIRVHGVIAPLVDCDRARPARAADIS